MNNREALYRSAISCRHEITHDQIILYVDSRKEGNALSQLADRLEQAALASQQDHEPYAYEVPTKDGTKLVYAIYYTKYNNPLPEGAIPLYTSQQNHIGDSSKLVKAVNALAAQTGESAESITEWLTDKGGLTQLMLSHFGETTKIKSLAIPTELAIKKISQLRKQGFAEYPAVTLRKDDKYCFVWDYGDVRWVQSQAQQEPVRPWICPNFMLPPRSEEVLVYPMPNNVAHTAFHDGECWRVTEYENNYGYSLVALPDGVIKGWMPIPPAPEGDKP